ncbi:MAG: radical SAM protein [Deltaproteobacteria bacterium]|nr:radical SAM protein [Deltaproteobacteria bacterium]
MKILLVYPYPLFDRSRAYEQDIHAVPIGLYYIGAVLKEHGYDVEVLNWSQIHKTPEKIIDTLRKKKPDILGFSILNANRWAGIEIARIAKSLNPDTRIIFGGVGATFLWKHLLTHFAEIDYIVLGEAESVFLKLVQALEKPGGRTLKHISGIAFRDRGKIVKAANAPLVKDLDSLPIPARYFTYQHVVSSRGCPGGCTFCGSPRFWKRRVRFRSPAHFVRELKMLRKKGIRFFYVSDDTFAVNKKRVVQICKAILEADLGITWVAISRVDHVDEEVLDWMRMAGCVQISYGVESGSKEIRKRLGKPLRTRDIKCAFALTRSRGILARAYFIYGAPGETQQTIQQTVDLIRQIKPFVCVSYILEIYPGTALYLDYQKAHHLTDDIWLKRIEGLPYFETDPGLTKEMVMAFGKTIRQAVYENLERFVDSLDLIDDKRFFPTHADFCSRLGMTLTHGDYAGVNAIHNKDEIAEKLFNKALGYATHPRAYLGLAMLRQDKRDFQAAAAILEQGVKEFPENQELNVCFAINCMNLGNFQAALDRLDRFPEAPGAAYYIEECRRNLDKKPQQTAFSQKARR